MASNRLPARGNSDSTEFLDEFGLTRMFADFGVYLSSIGSSRWVGLPDHGQDHGDMLECDAIEHTTRA